MSVNNVFLIGLVGQEPRVRQAGDTKVANISLATSKKYHDRSGETREETQWHTISAFGRLAEIIEKYVKKGDEIYVGGEIRYRKYTNAAGEERSVTEINADTIQLLGGKKKDEGSRPAQSQRRPQGQTNPDDFDPDLGF